MTQSRFLECSAMAIVLSMILTESFQPAAGQESRPETKSPSAADTPIDFDKARGLMRKRQGGGKLTAEEEAYLRRAMEEFRKRNPGGGGGGGPAPVPRESTGMIPLTEMSADARYKGEDGGLYGAGKNEPPEAHRKAAEAALSRIEPLDGEGRPSKDGRVVFVSISMSNATQEFLMFKRLADADEAKSPRLTIVDCAQGGQAMAEWAPPEAQPWSVAERRLRDANVTPQQVQVAWVKLANKGPRGDLEEHGRKLAKDTTAVLQNAKSRFPNLKIAYLSSRIYGGYAGGNLNPEPYAYESAFVCRWLIQDQIADKPELRFDADAKGAKVPLLLWGPYLWADGVKPRKSDGLVYQRDDLAGDGTHPSDAGRRKVARVMLDFYKSDPLAKSWFTGK